jgi:hypothetical protein
MRGRAGRHCQIEHERKKAEPQRLRALGRMVERGGQRLGLFRVRLAIAVICGGFACHLVYYRFAAPRPAAGPRPEAIANYCKVGNAPCTGGSRLAPLRFNSRHREL